MCKNLNGPHRHLLVGRKIYPTSALPEVSLPLSLMYEDGGCGEHVGWDATELHAGHINKGAAQSYPPGPLSVVILTCRRLTRNNAASRTLCNMQRPDGRGLFG